MTDTDVIIWEGDPTDPTRKPPEMYTLIENFCLGTRRLEIFGKAPESLRRGWVTVLAEKSSSDNQTSDDEIMMEVEGGTAAWNKESWESGIKALANGGKCVVPMTTDIDALRPKSPFRPGATGSSLGGTTGGTSSGMGMGISGARGGHPGAGNRSMFGNAGQMQGGGFGPGQNQMMVPPMMRMGMGALGGMGMVGVGEEGMVPGMVGWPGMMGMANTGVQGIGNMGLAGMMGMGPQGQMHMGQMGMGPGGSGSGFQGQGLGGGGGTFAIGGFNGGPMPGMGMGWPGDAQGQQQQFIENQGMWDGVDGLMGMGIDFGGHGGVGMNGMGQMGGMTMGGMGMGQWGAGGVYDGY